MKYSDFNQEDTHCVHDRFVNYNDSVTDADSKLPLSNTSLKGAKQRLTQTKSLPNFKTRHKRRVKRDNFPLESPVFVETAVFVDRDLFDHMKINFPVDTDRELIRFVLAMINAVSNIVIIKFIISYMSNTHIFFTFLCIVLVYVKMLLLD